MNIVSRETACAAAAIALHVPSSGQAMSRRTNAEE
jgi:hypothetical protein